ncbi:MAG: hypothetical protein HY273_04855 [Gammaproteobacteria bacterium]|nr:hypothetical protein [Gammaproteobacteria bacterium]
MRLTRVGKVSAVTLLGMSVFGCAILQGTVTPIEGGQYKSFAQSNTKDQAMRIAANDAKLTCKEAGNKNFVVVSQVDQRNGPEEPKSGNKWLDTAISMSNVGADVRKNTTFEVTTLFKCE